MLMRTSPKEAVIAICPAEVIVIEEDSVTIQTEYQTFRYDRIEPRWLLAPGDKLEQGETLGFSPTGFTVISVFE